MTEPVQSENPILEKLKSSKNIPSLPQVLLKLIQACRDETTSTEELARLTARDPALVSRVLRLVNSAYTGLREPVTSIERAVVHLGADTLKNIAISTSVLQAFSRIKGNTVFNLPRFWWHCFMCAAVCRRIAVRKRYRNPEEAFLSGLLHDIGKLILWRHFPKAYGRILSETEPESEPLPIRERSLGADHTQTGAWLMQHWQLDPLMADAVGYHHEPVEEIRNAFPLVQIVFVANLLSHAGAADTDRSIAESLLGLTAEQVESLRSDARDEVQEVAHALDIPVEPPPQPVLEITPADEDDLLKEIKNISLLYGTLESLLKADGRDSILTIIDRGLKILFDVRTLFFFLYDSANQLLMAHVTSGSERLKDLSIARNTQSCLPVRCLLKGAVLDSFRQPKLSIADKQIIRLLESEGLLCLPLLAHQHPLGVVVMGIEAHQMPRFTEQERLLHMFAGQGAACLYVDEMKRKREREIQEERMEAASLMARKVVHEVNNPLGVIKNYLKILGLKLPEKHPAQGDLGVIEKEIDRVFQIVRQLNSFSHPAKQKSVPLDINALISDQLKLLRKSLLEPAGIQDHLSLQTGLPPLTAHEGSLKQVVLNLVKNAVEAMPDGGNIHIATRHVPVAGRRLEGDEDRSAGSIELRFRDDGPGIPEAVKPRLFEPMVSSKGGHRGLGLSIVHNIVKELNGTITVDSHVETGTCFTISLPIGSVDPTS